MPLYRIRELDREFIKEVEQLARTKVNECYQCGKCTAGCPIADEMDIGPAGVMRLVQLGDVENALNNKTIWLCASCITCTTRCPKNIEIADVMDALREIAHRRRMPIPEIGMISFHRNFLKLIKKFGHVWEIGLTMMYKFGSWDFLGDMEKGLMMLKKDKFKLKPYKTEVPEEIKEMIEEVLKERES